jgi:hypothetical protein
MKIGFGASDSEVIVYGCIRYRSISSPWTHYGFSIAVMHPTAKTSVSEVTLKTH